MNILVLNEQIIYEMNIRFLVGQRRQKLLELIAGWMADRNLCCVSLSVYSNPSIQQSWKGRLNLELYIIF